MKLNHIIGLLLFALILVTSCRSNSDTTSVDRKPNVIILFTDQHQKKVLGFEGHPDVITPNLDRLASEGLAFSNYHVAPSCSISRVMLLTGSYAPRTGMSRNFTPSSTVGIHADEVTLADEDTPGAPWRSHAPPRRQSEPAGQRVSNSSAIGPCRDARCTR